MGDPSQPNYDEPIVPDENPHGYDDPAFLTESDVASSTQSLSSSVLNYQYENGRRYHAFREGEYPIPNDEVEQDRMDLNHHIHRLVVGGDLYRAPIDPSEMRILDLGTGTGIWAIEMADEFPGANVTGTDLSPIQPGLLPSNCRFEVDDFESDWDFSKPFDFIHVRNLAGSVRDWTLLIQRIKDNLNNGGWVEMVDFDGGGIYCDDNTGQKAPNIQDWVRFQQESSRSFGKDLDVAQYHKRWMIEAGFKNVHEEIYKASHLFVTIQVPLNPWPKDRKLKELGRYEQANMMDGLEAYSLALYTRVLGWTPEETRAFLAKVRREIVDRSIHLYTKFYFVYGQKDEGE
ncbi:Methyltransferase [Aspergillus sclerotialis]|uniref:Methyltransferase n=1 Tax=Aspergillus sclerotialis TaxID=2070753 RepID=A0A3A2ZVD7_9EURO|nr:Methyltransferase [Aspergillus sclerotialis]